MVVSMRLLRNYLINEDQNAAIILVLYASSRSKTYGKSLTNSTVEYSNKPMARKTESKMCSQSRAAVASNHT